MAIFLFLVLSYLLLSVALYFVFAKAGEKPWKGLVPGLNFVLWARLIGRKPEYALLLLVPIVNIFIYAGMAVDMARSFGKFSFWQAALAVIYAPGYFLYLGLRPEEKYLGPALEAERAFMRRLEEARQKGDKRTLRKLMRHNPYQKSALREWAEAIIFAVFAAAFIRMFLIEAYTIPTSSMEQTLLVGDFLFVSKVNYGIRTPQTVLMVPLLHNRIPGLDRESYLAKPNIPFTRLPALERIDHNEIVVFNYPEGDSVYVFPQRTWSVHDFRRGSIPEPYAQAIRSGRVELVVRPIDKKDHYIKRCIGLPGDTLEIRNRQVYINGRPAPNPEKMQFLYRITPPNRINPKKLEAWGVNTAESNPAAGLFFLTREQVEKIKALDPDIQVEVLSPDNPNPYHLFPHDPEHFPGWTVDNYGPVWIPKKGATIELKPENIAMFRRVITAYEHHTLEMRDGKFFIDGKEAKTYTFQQDYYWMMGDNRHNSEDSRVWGFVPHDHVVGKPLFIWFSLKNGSLRHGIRWNRLFMSANQM